MDQNQIIERGPKMRPLGFSLIIPAVLVAAIFCQAEAGELLVNGDFSQDWTVGWERVIKNAVSGTETVSSNGKVRMRLNGIGDIQLSQYVEVSSLDGLKFRAKFKPQSIEHLYGIGYAAVVFVGIGYQDKEGEQLGYTMVYDLNCFCVDLPGAQGLLKDTPTAHYIRVGDNVWTTGEIQIMRELQDHLPGIDPKKIAILDISLGIWNFRDESEGILEVDDVSLIGPDANRVISLIDASDAFSDTVRTSINLITKEGGENALGFSLIYDPAALSNPAVTIGRDVAGANIMSNSNQAASGRYGILLALSTGEALAPGTYQIAMVTFIAVPGAMVDSTTIDFGDQPVTREIADVKATPLFSVSWLSGSVRISRGYEADVAPRSKADGKCTVADWSQVGRFVARLDVAMSGPEFQKADCAPRISLGNGQLTVADWTQAGRYVARLDLLASAGGPMEPASAKPIVSTMLTGASSTSVVRAVGAVLKRGETGLLQIELDAQGNENALGFSLIYDPNALRFEQAIKGHDVIDALLLVNLNQSADGYLGIALALPSGQTLRFGTQTILEISFTALWSSAVTTNISFGDQPIEREIVDAFAVPVRASYSNAVMTLTDIATAAETGVKQRLPVSYALFQNSPNPFNSGTVVSYDLPKAADIRLEIYDILGRPIRNLINGYQQPGSYVAIWDGRDEEQREMASGTYFYRLEVSDRRFTAIKRMLLLR